MAISSVAALQVSGVLQSVRSDGIALAPANDNSKTKCHHPGARESRLGPCSYIKQALIAHVAQPNPNAKNKYPHQFPQ